VWNLKLSCITVVSHSVLRNVPADDGPGDDPRGLVGVSDAVREWTAIRGEQKTVVLLHRLATSGFSSSVQ
jgi:hypothetical protein